MNENLNLFLEKLSWNKEFNNLKTIFSLNSAKRNKAEDIFFVSGIKEKDGRASDNDIIEKNYFFLDFDLRENVKINENRIISDIELNKMIGDLLLELEQIDKFKEWGACVNSGNGVHFYYINGSLPYIDKIKYREGVSDIIEELNEILSKKNKNFVADIACCNIGRLSRLPGSLNHKRQQKYGLPAKEVVLLGVENTTSQLINEIYDRAEKRKTKTKAQTINNHEKNLLKKEWFEDRINKILEIPLAPIVCSDFGFTIAPDNKNFLHENRKG